MNSIFVLIMFVVWAACMVWLFNDLRIQMEKRRTSNLSQVPNEEDDGVST